MRLRTSLVKFEFFLCFFKSFLACMFFSSSISRFPFHLVHSCWEKLRSAFGDEAACRWSVGGSLEVPRRALRRFFGMPCIYRRSRMRTSPETISCIIRIESYIAILRSSFATGLRPSVVEYGNTKRLVAGRSGGCTRILGTLIEDDRLTLFSPRSLAFSSTPYSQTDGDSQPSNPTLVFT